MLKLTFKSGILINVIDLSLIPKTIRNYMDTHNGEQPTRSLYHQIDCEEKYSVQNKWAKRASSFIFSNYTLMKTLKE